MNAREHVAARLDRACRILALDPTAAELLDALVRLDLDPEFAAEMQRADPQHRDHVLSWEAVLDTWLAGTGADAMEAAVGALLGWGLLQVVGRDRQDPIVPGYAPLRLTPWGRLACGLGPLPGARMHAPVQEAVPWLVLHGASRERGVLEAARRLGERAVPPLDAARYEREGDDLHGRIAAELCAHGAVVVDAHGCGEESAFRWEALVRGTARARAPRILLLGDPSAVRLVAAETGAALQWVEPDVETRWGRRVLDRGLTAELLGRNGASVADVRGVPDSDLAIPHRVSVAWEALHLPDDVRWQFDQALMHARFRLQSVEPSGRSWGYRLLLSGLPGTGKSMAAAALATTLGRPVVRMDLSAVLSKWLGETEKMLAEAFDVAEASGAVLVLDEAEALLRQRDTGDHGGGGLGGLMTGVAYLLTRLDRFRGLMVATTNRTRDLDEAFFRRFDDYIVMPIPDQPTRRSLWAEHLGGGDGIDLDLLAQHFAISGGLIQAAAIRARAWAAGMGRSLDTTMVLGSLVREMEKSDRSPTGSWEPAWREGVDGLLRRKRR